jgi:hypothetical protein
MRGLRRVTYAAEMRLIRTVNRGVLRAVDATIGRTSFGRSLVFRYIHRSNHWRSSGSISGPGSELSDTEGVRTALPALLKKLGVRTLINVPCGDLHWLRTVDLELEHYYGFDIVPAVIDRLRQEQPIRNGEYAVADLVSADLPRADAILCRDVFLHLPFRDIRRALANLQRSGSRYLLASTYEGVVNEDLPTGRARPVDLTAAPISLPAPLMLVDERAPLAPTKRLGVWDLQSLELT